jgi:two-component system cell cycle response regulator
MKKSEVNPRVLCVEDDPKSRLIIRKLLENAGCQVFEAVDGNQGVEKALALHPDVILMDIMLPGMNGLEATRKIRESKKTEKIPIIALTAKAMAGDREQILAAGCNDYIAKPIDLSLLLHMLSQILGRELILDRPFARNKAKETLQTILLVDDTPKNVIVLEKILKSEGYTVFTAPHGESALEILTEQPVDLIISDIAMPVMDGYRLCYEVMTNPETARIRFIFYSSHYSNRREVEFGLRLGADKYLVRPLTLEELIKTIKRVMNTEKELTEPMTAEEFQKLHSDVLTSKMIEIAPVKEPFEKMGIVETLEMGRSYLIKEKTPKKSYSLFLDQLSQGFSGLCLTRTHPRFVKNHYNLEKTPCIWLSSTKTPGIASTVDLTELSLSVKNFISKTEKSIILLDGIEFLSSRVGFSVMLEFVQLLTEAVSNNACILLIPVSPETLTQKEVSMLERELTPLA